jgi:protein-S-isoprenylcysteine O-methyltransferase Ste14
VTDWHAWRIQLGLAALSLPWLAPYALAFRLGRVRGATRTGDLVYNLGFLLNVTWVAMLFCPQPRLPGLFDRGRLSGAGLLPVVLGAALVVTFTRANVRAMAANAAAVRRRYDRPAVLLREGAYRRVRNPMNTGGLFVFLGLGLLLGAAYTLLLFPIYFVANHGFTAIEERAALRPTFGAAFDRYAAEVPRYFDRRHVAVLACVAACLFAAWWRFPPIP